MKYTKTRGQGFTLIELMVVVSIITMLSSVVLAVVQPIRARARDAKRQQELHQLDLAIQQYILDKGYPPAWEGCAAQLSSSQWWGKATKADSSGCIAVSTAQISGGNNNWALLEEVLGTELPSDPCGTDCGDVGYTYYAPAAVQDISNGSNSNYQLYAKLENGSTHLSSSGGSQETSISVLVSEDGGADYAPSLTLELEDPSSGTNDDPVSISYYWKSSMSNSVCDIYSIESDEEGTSRHLELSNMPPTGMDSRDGYDGSTFEVYCSAGAVSNSAFVYVNFNPVNEDENQ